MPVSRGRSPRVRAFCSDISRSNQTVLYPKSSSHCIHLVKILTKVVTSKKCWIVECVPTHLHNIGSVMA